MSKAKKQTITEPAVIEDITHEEVEIQENGVPAVQPKILTLEQQKQQEIAKFDKAEAVIKGYKKKYGSLVIKGVEDKSGYSKVKEAWQEVRGARIGFEKKHKEITADYVQVKRAIDDYKNGLVESITPLEDKLGDEWRRIDQAKEAEKDRKEKEEQEKLQGRVNELISAGMTFNGSYYVIGENISIDVLTIKVMPDEEYTTFLQRVNIAGEKIRKDAADKLAKEEENKRLLKEQGEAQEKERLRLQNEKDDLQKQKDEMEQQRKEMAEQRLKIRVNLIEGLGMKWSYNTHGWSFQIDGITLVAAISMTFATDSLEIPFKEKFDSLVAEINEIKLQKSKKDEEDKRINGMIQSRIESLMGLGFKMADGGYIMKSPYNKNAECFVTYSQIKDLDRDFVEILNEAKAFSENVAEEIREQNAKACRYGERVETLRCSFGMVDNGKFFERRSKFEGIDDVISISKESVFENPESDWQIIFPRIAEDYGAVVEKEKQKAIEIQAEKEKQRLSLLSDKDKAIDYFNKLENVQVPEIVDSNILNLLQILNKAIIQGKQAINEV